MESWNAGRDGEQAYPNASAKLTPSHMPPGPLTILFTSEFLSQNTQPMILRTSTIIKGKAIGSVEGVIHVAKRAHIMLKQSHHHIEKAKEVFARGESACS